MAHPLVNGPALLLLNRSNEMNPKVTAHRRSAHRPPSTYGPVQDKQMSQVTRLIHSSLKLTPQGDALRKLVLPTARTRNPAFTSISPCLALAPALVLAGRTIDPHHPCRKLGSPLWVQEVCSAAVRSESSDAWDLPVVPFSSSITDRLLVGSVL